MWGGQLPQRGAMGKRLLTSIPVVTHPHDHALTCPSGNGNSIQSPETSSDPCEDALASPSC